MTVVTPPTAQHLADSLRTAGFHDLAKRAEACEFHDYLSPHALPELMLDKELIKIIEHNKSTKPERQAATDIRARLHDGEFDASKEESDQWAVSPDGQAAFRMLKEGK